VTFLIDGYNLIHAVGLARKDLPAGTLKRARARLLDWLADVVKDRSGTVRVVFDGVGSPANSPESEHRGVRVRFAFRKTADDEIEELLLAETRPEQIAVVSNDARVREAGRRRGSVVLTCEEFVDWTLDGQRNRATDLPRAPTDEKSQPRVSTNEMAVWLAAFSSPPARRRKR
jgi:predicted RNA-binding protein with PIN domain